MAVLGAIFTVVAWRNGAGFAFLLPAAMAAFVGLGALRDVRARQFDRDMTLVLSPDSIRLTSSDSAWQGVVLWRDRAGWLVEDEIRTDWHVRHIWIHDQNEQLVAQFVGGLAAVEVSDPGIPSTALIASELPVSVLLGTWWPHPARRTSRRGNWFRPVQWREPDIDGFPPHERRNRLQWTLLYAGFAALFLWAAVASGGQAWIRIAFGIAGLVLIVWRITVHRWQPTFLATDGATR